VLQQWILRLLLIAIALPILMCLLFGLGYLLTALEDEAGALVVVRTNLVLAVLWVFDLLLLIIALALGSLVDGATRSAEAAEEAINRSLDEEQ
jgi:hypothetical protein